MGEVFVSVDLETSGPNPRDYAILSIGACLVDDPEQSFYVELKPTSDLALPAALAVSGLSMEELARTGTEPELALRQFEEWLATLAGPPIFVAFNAAFDWMFIEDYFRRFLGSNPFGHSALDIKAYAMGHANSTWAATSMKFLSPRYLNGRPLEHNALSDARDQAELFRALRAQAASRTASTPESTREDAMPDSDLQSVIDSARRLGIELDEADTIAWLEAIAASPSEADDIVIDVESGTFGHRISMLDFSPRDLERFRRIGSIVEVTGPAGVAESALALSGSAAQSKIQTFPGDCDYFQRLNITAPTREEACAIMATLMRDHVLAHTRGATYQFLEAKLGSWPFDCTQDGAPRRKGSPMSWRIADIEAGEIHVDTETGPQTLAWNDVALDPGWCKLDWVVADEGRRQLSNASNVIDVTWEAPDGDIVPLDGYLDAFFQEVYLDAEALPVFAKVAKFVSDDALDDYVEKLEQEVRKYLTDHVNYGKAAKRMYNVFRLSGRHLDAAFVRELFDEPATILYQVWSLIVALENATEPGSAIAIDAVQAQADSLVLAVVEALEGEEETEIVRALLRLRQTLEGQASGEERTAEVEAAQTHVVNVINTFYREKLIAMPTIRDYMENIQASR